jgi:outer membrane protein OmpA-like peptidoglycan-associated protein
MRYTQFFLTMLLSLFLLACSSQPSSAVYRYGQSQRQHQRTLLLEQIAQQGVKVYKVGDHTRFWIPIDVFFNAGSLQLKSNKNATLSLISKYIVNFLKPGLAQRFSVSVMGYAKYHSSEYAQVIASHLWADSISKKRMSVRGLANHNQIASNATPAGYVANRRVMIDVY